MDSIARNTKQGRAFGPNARATASAIPPNRVSIGMEPEKDITILLARARDGDAVALESVMARVYDQLRALARRQLAGEAQGHTLGATALVHEAYLQLLGERSKDFADRAHFFAYAARAMRHILIDHARRRQAAKRGGDAEKVSLSHAEELSLDSLADQTLLLEQALLQLESEQPRLARIVELRYYAGLSVDDTAAALGVAPRTVDRDWRLARAYLQSAIDKDHGDG